jgi:hypothetical protein
MGVAYVDPMDKDKDDLRYILVSEYEKIDKHMSGSIDAIAASCPLLRTFTMHLLTADVRSDDFLQVILDKSDESPVEHTVEAFKNLKIRHTICIVAVMRLDQYKNLRRGIAPLDEWQMRELEKWPGISIIKGEVEMFSTLLSFEDDYGDRDEDLHLRMWCFQPKASKALGLPGHVQVEEGPYAYEDFIYDSDNDGESEIPRL